MSTFKYLASNKKWPKGRVLRVLLAFDFLFILLHIISGYLRYKKYIYFNDIELASFSLSKDGGYSEIFQYLKELTISGVLFCIYLKKQINLFGVLALFFLYIFLDDSIRIHERLGELLSQKFGHIPWTQIDPKYIGELLTFIFVGILFSVLIFLNKRDEISNFFVKFNVLVKLIGLLIFFGVGIDLIHSLVLSEYFLNAVFVILEDGGELFIMSFILFYVLNLGIKAFRISES